MKKISVCLLVLLAVCSLSLTLVPGAFSQSETQNVKIVDYSYYIDSLGYLAVVGEIQNIGTNTIATVVLTGVATTSDGLAQNSITQAWVSNLISQQKAPFYMDFYPPEGQNGWFLGDISDISLTVEFANATSDYQYPDLTVTSSKGSIGTSGDFNGAYVVNGVIKNTGTQAATNLTVVGTFYNSTGYVVGVGYTNYLTPTVLEPSATTSFQIAAFDLNQSVVPNSMKITSYSLLVQTQGPILQGTAPQATPYAGSQNPTPTNSQSSTTSPSNTSTIGQGSQPNSTSNLPIYAAVVVIAILGIVAALFFLKKRNHNA
jgi:hypothetical protein